MALIIRLPLPAPSTLHLEPSLSSTLDLEPVLSSTPGLEPGLSSTLGQNPSVSSTLGSDLSIPPTHGLNLSTGTLLLVILGTISPATILAGTLYSLAYKYILGSDLAYLTELASQTVMDPASLTGFMALVCRIHKGYASGYRLSLSGLPDLTNSGQLVTKCTVTVLRPKGLTQGAGSKIPGRSGRQHDHVNSDLQTEGSLCELSRMGVEK